MSVEISGEFRTRSSLMKALESIKVVHDHRPNDDGPFNSWIQRRHYGGAIFAEMCVDPCISHRRDSSRIALEEYVCITAQTRGRQQFTQTHAEVEAEAGDIFVWSAHTASRSICPEIAAVKTLMIPRRLAERRLGNISDLYGRKAARDDGMTHLAFAHLMNLHDNVHRVPGEKIGDVVIATLELLRCCMPDTGQAYVGTTYQKEVFARAVSFVRANLTDPDISLTAVADHLGLSTRSLQQLFSMSATTFGAFVRKERLIQASQSLASPSFGKLSVTELAHRFGFYDLAHFSRAFKAEFGCSPKNYRDRLSS